MSKIIISSLLATVIGSSPVAVETLSQTLQPIQSPSMAGASIIPAVARPSVSSILSPIAPIDLAAENICDLFKKADVAACEKKAEEKRWEAFATYATCKTVPNKSVDENTQEETLALIACLYASVSHIGIKTIPGTPQNPFPESTLEFSNKEITAFAQCMVNTFPGRTDWPESWFSCLEGDSG